MPAPTFPPSYPPHIPPPYGYPHAPGPPAAAPPPTPSTGPSFQFPASFQTPSPVSESDLEFLHRRQPSTVPASTASSAGKGKKRASEEASSVPTKKPKPAAQTSTKSSGKGKGKAKAAPEPAKGSAHTGRQPGSHNYNDDDIETVLDIAEDLLPIGQNAWAEVTRRFNTWAEDNGRPSRTQKPLKTKFESVSTHGYRCLIVPLIPSAAGSHTEAYRECGDPSAHRARIQHRAPHQREGLHTGARRWGHRR